MRMIWRVRWGMRGWRRCRRRRAGELKRRRRRGRGGRCRMLPVGEGPCVQMRFVSC